jgi:hypothetical protein
MEKRLVKRSHASLRSRPTAAPVARVHRRASSIVRSRAACFGFPTKTTRPSVELKLILISASGARSAPAKVLMAHFSTVVRGMQSRWSRLRTGRLCTESRCPILLQLLPPKSFINARLLAALNGLNCQGRLFFYPIRFKSWALQVLLNQPHILCLTN